MLLQRKVVEILNDYNISNGSISLDDFVNYVLKGKWPQINYYYCKDNVFKRKIETAIKDCMERDYAFIVDKNGDIRVTHKGRDFLKILGFFEELLKRRKRTIVNTTSFIFGGLVTYLVNYFLNKY